MNLQDFDSLQPQDFRDGAILEDLRLMVEIANTILERAQRKALKLKSPFCCPVCDRFTGTIPGGNPPQLHEDHCPMQRMMNMLRSTPIHPSHPGASSSAQSAMDVAEVPKKLTLDDSPRRLLSGDVPGVRSNR